MENEIYEWSLKVLISSDNHDHTLHVFKKVKNLRNAFDYCTTFYESKSARSGVVLKREVQIRITNYPGEIISFRQALLSLCNHYNIFLCSVTLRDTGAYPDGMRKNFPNL